MVVGVEVDLPDNVAGTQIVQVGERPRGTWFSWDSDACAWVAHDVEGDELFRIGHTDIVGRRSVTVDWEADPPALTWQHPRSVR